MYTASPSRFNSRLFLAVACVLFALPVMADSQARIVRLSDVQGSVQIDKNAGLGFENAFVNLPITQGTQLRTGNGGRAEIEFEDGSSMRLAPNTTVQFSRLSLADSGKRMSEISLSSGMAYLNWLGKDDLALNFSSEKISLDRAAHFRVDASSQVANLAVFKGDVEVQCPAGEVKVEKKKTATFDAGADDKYTIANKLVGAPLDSWDKEAVAYHKDYAKNNSSPYGYGVSDLNYYGSYTNVPGYGMMWQPYFTGVGWDPFMNGAWGFYPGYGYMFASAYPWGWMPYRYGTWMFVPRFGWMWQGGGYGTWLTTPAYRATTLVKVTPLTPPASGTVKTIVVGKVGATSVLAMPRMTVNAGSAGLGIPRGSLGSLSQLNHQVLKTGVAEVQPAPQFSAVGPSRTSSPAYSSAHSGMAMQPMGHASASSHASAGAAGAHR